ncbi:MAG: nitrilase-related carbon-nitrogen hydrolase [Candidatus Hermodarchaeota archaeon]
MVRITQVELLNRAEAEEKKYNLKEAIRLYKQVLENFIDKDDLIKVAQINEKIGNIYVLATLTADTEKELTEMIDDAVEAYDKAIKIYTEMNNKVKVLECMAGQFKVKSDKGISPEYSRKQLLDSFEKYMELSEIYNKENDNKNLLRILSQTSLTLALLLQCCYDPIDFEDLFQKGDDIVERGLNLSYELGYKQYIGNFFFVGNFIIGIKTWVTFSRIDKLFWRNSEHEKLLNKFLDRSNEGLKFIEESDDKFNKALFYHFIGSINCQFAARFIHDEKEQKDLADKGIKYCEEALDLMRELNFKPFLIHYIFWLDYFLGILGRYQYLQKRILGDITEIQEKGKAYQNIFSFWGFLTNFLSAVSYQFFTQRSYLKTDLRRTYAKKGIKEIEDGLKKLNFGPFFSLSYQILTNLYSQLVHLTPKREKRESFIDSMFKSASEAEKAGKMYKAGMSRAAGYISLYRAHKTLSDVLTNKEEKIKNLSIAIDAITNNIEFSVESYRDFIADRMHLGLLYEDLAILTKQKEPLFQARELFLHLIKDTNQKGYYYHTAAAYEYLARIEDRLGNHLTSAQQYEMASNAHLKSLEKVQFKPLKDRIKEKSEYDKAWKLIENAKVNHKKEDHLKAKEEYDMACEILKTLSKYRYEASYYSSWAYLEVSEDASKKEEHQVAIDKYQDTKNCFEKSINILEDTLTQSSNKIEIERITKLKKVANVRINYCLARINLEKARILQKQSDHLSAAENFALAASQFRDICTIFKIERERKELEAIYHLCRAWEGMELAENYQEPERFIEASKLFLKASNLFIDSKLKLLASGNSSVCLALENGCKFDESTDMGKKADYYKKVKMMLRKASSSYEKGGFIVGADWALGTTIYFDGLWHLIKADEELELNIRKKQLEVGSKYLKSAAEIFGKSGYKERQEEIYEKLNRIEREELILYSALNTISNPVISRSTVGIVAPACPIESSLSPKISEINQLTLEATELSETQEKVKKYSLKYKDLLTQYPKIQRNECRIGVAQIGLSESGNILKEFFKIKKFGLLGIKEDIINSLRSTYKEMIERANSDRINILVFPEMMIDLNYTEIIEDLMNYSKVYNMYIIPGSYHDEKSKKNISVVIGPEGFLWEQEKHIPATIHIEGNKVKEAIDTSSYPRNTTICNTEFGRIAIVICRDFLDMDLRVELKNFEPPVDIVINPAFTPVTADFKAAHFDARRSIYAYCFFANVAEFGDSLIYTPEKDRTERNIPAKEEGLIYKDINLFKLRSERKKWEKEQKKELQFIQSTR